MTSVTTRREFISTLAGGLLAAPLRPRRDREPVAAQDGPGSEGNRDADAHLRPLETVVSGPPPGARGSPDLVGRPLRQREWR